MSRIEWKVEINGANSIIRDFEALDKSLFQDKGFATSIWNDVFKKISGFVQKRFEEGKTSSWKPLSLPAINSMSASSFISKTLAGRTNC